VKQKIFCGGDESYLLQKYRIYSSKILLPVVDFGQSWTTVLLAKLISSGRVAARDVRMRKFWVRVMPRMLTTVRSCMLCWICCQSTSAMYAQLNEPPTKEKKQWVFDKGKEAKSLFIFPILMPRLAKDSPELIAELLSCRLTITF